MQKSAVWYGLGMPGMTSGIGSIGTTLTPTGAWTAVPAVVVVVVVIVVDSCRRLVVVIIMVEVALVESTSPNWAVACSG